MATTNSYREIRADILDRVRSGEWPPGSFIPAESKLAERYGCSRVTVNRALRELAAEGVVLRRRKAGTQVTAGRPRTTRLQIPVVKQEVLARGVEYRYQCLRSCVRRLTVKAAQKLGLKSGDEALYLRCLHWSDHRPHQLEERWISLAAVPEARDHAFDRIGANEWLIQVKPLSDAEHVLYARAARLTEVKLLGLAEDEPVFVIERRTWLDGEAMTWVQMSHPANSFRLQSMDSVNA